MATGARRWRQFRPGRGQRRPRLRGLSGRGASGAASGAGGGENEQVPGSAGAAGIARTAGHSGPGGVCTGGCERGVPQRARSEGRPRLSGEAALVSVAGVQWSVRVRPPQQAGEARGARGVPQQGETHAGQRVLIGVSQ